MKKVFAPYYIVKKGDTLASIAAKFEVSPTQILVENYLTPSSIKEGTILSITKKWLFLIRFYDKLLPVYLINQFAGENLVVINLTPVKLDMPHMLIQQNAEKVFANLKQPPSLAKF